MTMSITRYYETKEELLRQRKQQENKTYSQEEKSKIEVDTQTV